MDSEDQNSSRNTEDDKFELKCIHSIRALSADLPQAANSGHPGGAMGCAPMAHLLFGELMQYSPSKPEAYWNRDRFVLSNGHCCALQYVVLHLAGYDVTEKDLREFRKLGSRTPGHPENFMTAGVEVCTGPLGQGISNAVGMAMGAAHLGAVYNTPDYCLFDNYTYVICGDGCLQEGVSSEASSLAGHLGLGRLIVLYDDNEITIDGSTDLSFTEDVAKRYEAYGWHVQTVTDVETEGLGSLRAAVRAARVETTRPSLVKVKTSIGFGSSKQGTHAAHGAPLGEEDLKNTKLKYGLDPTKSFSVEDDVREFYKKNTLKLEQTRQEWEDTYSKYSAAHPNKAAELERRFAHGMPDRAFDGLYSAVAQSTSDVASRKSSQFCLNELAPTFPELVGGSADLTPSNLTALECSGGGDFQKDNYAGRYVRFGVREHAMAAVCNGLYAYGGFRPYCATFLNFAGYALGAVRVSALSRFGILYVTTHDSVGLGEDGPTHQPVEMLESLRAMPNLHVMRPADTNETAGAYRLALETNIHTPTVLCLSRSTIPKLEHSDPDKVKHGAYTVLDTTTTDNATPDIILVGSGSEMGLCVDAAKQLLSAHNIKVRVVSMPCQELFLQQSQQYQRSVLPGNVPTLSVEASAPHGWHRFSHAQIAVTTFGKSGKGSAVFEYFGFSTPNVVVKAKKLYHFYQNKLNQPVPNLMCRVDLEQEMNGNL